MRIQAIHRRWTGALAPYGWAGRWFARLLPPVLALLLVDLLLRPAPALVRLLLTIGIVAVAPLSLVVLWRVATRRLLWRVRNRLIVTYLLLGLAPILLFGTLTFMAGYLFAGQYATTSALRLIDQAVEQVNTEAAGFAMLSLAGTLPAQSPLVNGQTPASDRIALATMSGGAWRDLSTGPTPRSPFAGKASPDWLHSGFRGVVNLDGQLYLCSAIEVALGQRKALVLGSMPLSSQALRAMGQGLGRITLFPIGLGQTGDKKGSKLAIHKSPDEKSEEIDIGDPGSNDWTPSSKFERVSGGAVPAAKFLLDTRVFFSAPMTVRDWEGGSAGQAIVLVESRPTVLYDRLFAASAGIGKYVRLFLIGTAILFGIIELLALFMAIGLGRTITRSVAELYEGTVEIDRGNFAYRMPQGKNDQLGALSNSFNTMAASMVELLAQQREKQRLESELAIAQDVQRNLFPHSPMAFDGLEVHAVCIPARTVSGDYFDFFCEGRQFCLALGDISGKGMSAALLMASLHAAVRSLGLSAEAADHGAPSSARLVSLLNRQLFQSTQPERYATLFLTFYDGATRQLTYTNGGHLAPWLMSADGTFSSLDRGGPVVGLLNGLAYQETHLGFAQGDLLVAYSDGLTEAENESGEFGEERLFEFVSQHRSLPLDELAQRTLERVQGWIGETEQMDDMTILFARVTTRLPPPALL
ncbi:sigma-B regulation protein RsbU (phosphoserine phosphatase) [Granulicella rosea]|uniref:Sigma-B regulation protein RsbU (Phosphoserine phosphatase) n=1 Tax=Granulicella rosea TaxID=474952 RepID=A0A239DTW7_9BACT|nr:PP2C family protein-serine/threonine phosphatase [Granulicella rosea]SNS36055.1 sigma-B regulation protein RsbU (phosphoserine phosphatase) [Granulicella rosea]